MDIRWNSYCIEQKLKSAEVRNALVSAAQTRLPYVESSLASSARVRNGMKLLTVDGRTLDHTSAAVIHGYGPIGENIAKHYGINW